MIWTFHFTMNVWVNVVFFPDRSSWIQINIFVLGMSRWRLFFCLLGIPITTTVTGQKNLVYSNKIPLKIPIFYSDSNTHFRHIPPTMKVIVPDLYQFLKGVPKICCSHSGIGQHQLHLDVRVSGLCVAGFILAACYLSDLCFIPLLISSAALPT